VSSVRVVNIADLRAISPPKDRRASTVAWCGGEPTRITLYAEGGTHTMSYMGGENGDK
jgi:hypothetical protein